MKKTIFLPILVWFVNVSMAFAQEANNASEIIDMIPEVITALILLFSAYYTYKITRRMGGVVLKKGFMFLTIGLLIISFGFLWIALGEYFMFNHAWWSEITFEVLSILGVFFIVAAPIRIGKDIDELSSRWKK